MEQKGQLFYDTGDALAKIDVSGWTGRAADEFREAHDLEPDRWIKSGNGFRKAAAGLTTYAGALEDAQRRAAEAEAEYERGQRESESARTQYDSYMGRMRSYWASGGTDQAEPFVDWGDPIQQEALRTMQAVRSDLDQAAHTCAGQVRAGCADAPEEPNWLESGLKFVGGILEGAGEAVWDLLTMVPFSPVNLVIDGYKLASGDLTPEELAKKYELSVENAVDMAQGIYTGLTTDPVGFGKNLGKSLLDWDTWADDPARAIGHLVPDAIAAAANRRRRSARHPRRQVRDGRPRRPQRHGQAAPPRRPRGPRRPPPPRRPRRRLADLLDDGRRPAPHVVLARPAQRLARRRRARPGTTSRAASSTTSSTSRPAAEPHALRARDAQRGPRRLPRARQQHRDAEGHRPALLRTRRPASSGWAEPTNYIHDHYAADEVRGAVTVAETPRTSGPRGRSTRTAPRLRRHAPLHRRRLDARDPVPDRPAQLRHPAQQRHDRLADPVDSWSDPFTGNWLHEVR